MKTAEEQKVGRCQICNLLNSRLDQHLFVDEFTTSIAFVYKDQIYQGRTMVVLKRHETDITNLQGDEARLFYSEMLEVAEAVKAVFRPDLLNFAMLGNRVKHLHWHIIPRYRNDIRWRKAPWPHPRKYLRKKAYFRMSQAIRNELHKHSKRVIQR